MVKPIEAVINKVFQRPKTFSFIFEQVWIIFIELINYLRILKSEVINSGKRKKKVDDK